MRRIAGAGIAAAAVLSLAACGGEEEAAPSGDSGSQPGSSSMPSSSASSAPSSDAAAGGDGVTTVEDPYGPGCAQVPTEGPGSVGGMVSDPVATAASNNPLLTKLTAAVGATNLADTLNSQEGITVFAPADPAFDALGPKFDELAAAPDQLAPILQYHVVGKRYDRDGLVEAKTVESLNPAGGPLKIEGEGENMTVNGAKVLCGNVPTANATVFVIDTVMTPGANS
ncbi:fasciclin [Amycolatopsis antarctica]|uniref:Fasciclin n=1 Tax=Amycolatopsis antarctica TaxID=1854586 RepID=A0A263D9Q7_9PSEU|nr:fasciclin domain-containing protein [Amycolatopsis antarctica]OZM75244.1 fasciclin [Amycolatopsis antarctica]